MIETRVIAGRKCHICGNAPNDPYIYWGMQMHTPDDVKNLTERLEVYCTDKAYNLIAFECQYWNDDFSPWRAPAVYGTEEQQEAQLKFWKEIRISFIPYWSGIREDISKI